jgi:hypothetical protein
MPGQERARTQRRDQQLSGRTSLTLPRWESFPLEDRHRLVRTILQTARRHVETRPTSSHPRK